MVVHCGRTVRFGTNAYLKGAWKDNITSQTISRLMKSKEGRKGSMEKFLYS